MKVTKFNTWLLAVSRGHEEQVATVLDSTVTQRDAWAIAGYAGEFNAALALQIASIVGVSADMILDYYTNELENCLEEMLIKRQQKLKACV